VTSTVVLADSRVIFTDTYAAVCTTPTCQLKASGCGGVYIGSKVSVGASSPWALTAVQNVVLGYTETVCISCSNGLDTQTHTYNIAQNALICTSTLSAAASVKANPTMAYNSVTTTESTGIWTDFFQNSDTTNCPVTACTLYASPCPTAYATTYSSGKQLMSGISPWGITANKNILAGWTETVCISCTNGAQTIIKDNYIVI
jgi:hypothetical protein